METGGFLGLTIPQWHAALNDFPVALLITSVAFDLLATGPRREALRAAAHWTLAAGAAGAVLAVASGLVAEERIVQSPAAHRIIETHELMGIAVGVVFAGLAGWRIWRRNTFSEAEQQSYTMVSVVAALALIWTAHLGGRTVFRHAAGIPSEVLEAEIRDRAADAPQDR